jgi:DNA invertase Pin-like site-specific DNA recombinase
MKNKYAIYARVSTNDQHPENQREALLKKADMEGWDYDYYHEKETTRKTRPVKYDLYQNYLLKKKYKAVVVWRLDRWARTVRELVAEIPVLYNRGINFISLKENIDLSSATGKLQFHMICAFAEFERDLVSERTKEAFYIDENGVTRSIHSNKRVGRPKGSKDKVERKKSGYYARYANG